MISRFMLMSLAPFGIGVWVLATHTVGETLDPAHATSIGFAVALLTVLGVGYILCAPTKPSMAFALALVICGILSLADATLFQFYLASLPPPRTSRSAELMRFLIVSSCMTLLAGMWLILAGVCIGVARPDSKPRCPYTGTEADSDPARITQV